MNILATNVINLFGVFLNIISPNTQNYTENKKSVAVIDTSAILQSDTEILHKFKKEFIVIVPSVVISELHHISKKNSNADLKQDAQYALEELKYFFRKGRLPSGAQLLIPKLPLGSNFSSIDANDRKIINKTLEYKKRFKYPVYLVTQDNKMSLIAKGNGIQTKAYPFN